MFPSSSFSESNESAFTSSWSAFTKVAFFLLSKGEADSSCIHNDSSLSDWLASASLKVSRRDLGEGAGGKAQKKCMAYFCNG